MSLVELLNQVRDKESFVTFVCAMAEERAKAEDMERQEKSRYQLGGAHGWQNGDISSFLYAAVAFFEPGPHRFTGVSPTWRDFAEFLWMGKIYE